jgi:hypothetical protein
MITHFARSFRVSEKKNLRVFFFFFGENEFLFFPQRSIPTFSLFQLGSSKLLFVLKAVVE